MKQLIISTGTARWFRKILKLFSRSNMNRVAKSEINKAIKFLNHQPHRKSTDLVFKHPRNTLKISWYSPIDMVLTSRKCVRKSHLAKPNNVFPGSCGQWEQFWKNYGPDGPNSHKFFMRSEQRKKNPFLCCLGCSSVGTVFRLSD